MLVERVTRVAYRIYFIENVMREEMSISNDVMHDARIICDRIMKYARKYYDKNSLIDYEKEDDFDFTLVDKDILHVHYKILYFPSEEDFAAAQREGWMIQVNSYADKTKTMTITCVMVGNNIYDKDLMDVISHELTHRYEDKRIGQSKGIPIVNVEYLYGTCQKILTATTGCTMADKVIANGLYYANQQEIDAHTHGLYGALTKYNKVVDASTLLAEPGFLVNRILKAIDDALSTIGRMTDNERCKLYDTFGVRCNILTQILTSGKRKYLTKIGKICAKHNMEISESMWDGALRTRQMYRFD